MSNTLNAIGLVRVSTDRQDTDRQIDAIQQFCRLEGYNLYTILRERPGTSGRNSAVRKGGSEALQHYILLAGGENNLDPERPQLSSALWHIRNNYIDVLVIYALDRLSRDATELLLLQRIAEAHNVTLAIVNSGGALQTDTASGWLQFAMQALLAEHECRQIGERTSASLKAKSEAWAGGDRSGAHVGRPPVGWQKDPETGRYIHSNSWELVCRVAEMRKKGATYSNIAAATGVPRSSIKSYIDAFYWQPPTDNQHQQDNGGIEYA